MPKEEKKSLTPGLDDLRVNVTTAKGGDPSTVEAKNPAVEATPEEATELARKKAKKIKMAQVLQRGQLGDRLLSVANASRPPGYGYKWVLDRPEDVIRYDGLYFGFEYTEEGIKSFASADGRIRVGDLVLMTTQRENIEILREIQAETTMRRLSGARREFQSAIEEESEELRGAITGFDHSATVIDKRSERL